MHPSLASLCCCLALAQGVAACEMVIDLDSKARQADVIVLCEVTDLAWGEIVEDPVLRWDVRRVTIDVAVREVLKGAPPETLTINADSLSFSHPDGGLISVTAGFSATSIAAGQVYLAYLSSAGQGFTLAGRSKQYLEEVDVEAATVHGYGGDPVGLDEKLAALKDVIAGNGASPTPAEP